ncbi:MAG: VCBS repeat-containing protein [bacterium]|nr:VCBS repeat-containing protein [bacterium]
MMKNLTKTLLIILFFSLTPLLPADEIKFQELSDSLVKEVLSKIKSNKVVFLGLVPANPNRMDVFSGTLSNMFASKLREGKFIFPDEKELIEVKNKLGINRYNGFINAEFAKEVAKNLGSEIVVTGRIMDLGENIYINFQVFNGVTGDISAILEKEIKKDDKISYLLQTAVEMPRFNLPEDYLSLKREVHFPYDILDFEISDIDNDGINDFIALTPSYIRIFHLDAAFEEIMSFPYSVNTDIKIRSREKIGHIFITDLNHNGKKEIALSSFQDDGGEVFEWNEGKFQKIADLNDKIVAGTGEKPYAFLLLSSFLGGRNYYSGEAVKYLQADSMGELQFSDIYLPVDFYSLAMIAPDRSKEKKWCVLDNNGSLTVFDIDKKKIWQSGDMFGNYFESIDFDDSGRPELVMTSNEPVTKESFDYIYILEWNEIGPVLLWKSPKIEGSILKFHPGDIDNNKRMEFVAITRKGEKNYIQVYGIK